MTGRIADLSGADLTQAPQAWIQTHSGERFDLLAPRPEAVHIADIAHALAKLDRFGGHLPMHYSVAQHSLVVADHCPAGLRLSGLLHDAAEAYVGDLLTPIKRLLPDYERIERRIWSAIAERFGLSGAPHPEIKMLDRRVLVAEVQQLMPEPVPEWQGKFEAEPLPVRLAPMPWQEAKQAFLARYAELTGD